jgi:integrase
MAKLRGDGEGWLRKKKYSDGEMWLYCYFVTRVEDGKRVEHSKRVGLVEDFKTEIKAWVEVEKLGYKKLLDNAIPASPLFSELAAHWRKHDLKKGGVIGKRGDETVVVHESNLDGYILPRWGRVRALEIQPTEVETWFESLATTPQKKVLPPGKEAPAGFKPKPMQWGTVQKIKSCMSLIFAHALRNRLLPSGTQSPFRRAQDGGVRCKQSSSYEATVVTPDEMIAILDYLDKPETQAEWMMALLHAATAMRPEEGFGLQWGDVDWQNSVINLNRGWSKGKITAGKNEHSMTAVPMHPALAGYLNEWRRQSTYSKDEDWIFASSKLKGKQPRTPSCAAQDYLRKAAVEVGVIVKGSSKRFGWHNLRHSLATFLSGQVDPSVTMKMLRHKRLATTMEIYSHRVSKQQTDAQGAFLNAIKVNKNASEMVQ